MHNDLMTDSLSIKALDYINEIIEALRIEIEAVASLHRAPFLLKLDSCKFSHCMSGWKIYECMTDSHYVIKDNSSAVIFVPAPPADESSKTELASEQNANPSTKATQTTSRGYVAKIISCVGNQVFLACKEELRANITDASLIVNSSDDLTHLMKAMETVVNEKQTSNFDFAASIFEEEIAPVVFGAPDYIFERGKTINRSQKLAMQHAFANALTLIWGGPGTGKTSVLACSAEAHLRAGRRVLYLGQNNLAADKLIRTVCDRLQDTLYRDGTVLRLGLSADDAMTTNYSYATLDSHMAPFAEPGENMVAVPIVESELVYEGVEEKLDSQTVNKMRERVTEILNVKAVNIDTLSTNSTLSKFVINQARFVCGTFSEACDQGLLDKFDIVLLDDCNLISLPQLFWALGQAKTATTICGDFKQLRESIESKNSLAQKWLQRNIFDLFNVNSASDAESDNRMSILDEQYRMNPEIASLADELFYEGYLSSGKQIEKEFEDGMKSASAVVLADVSILNPGVVQTGSNGSANLINAMISASIAKKILQNSQSADVGIISTHQAQCDLINKMLHKWQLKKPVATTIEVASSIKRDVVILDIVDAPGPGSLFMNESSELDAKADMLLNAAITSANKKLYLVAHCDYLKKAHINKSLKRLITIFEQTPGKIDTTDLLATFAMPEKSQ